MRLSEGQSLSARVLSLVTSFASTISVSFLKLLNSASLPSSVWFSYMM